MQQGLQHEALLYRGHDDFVASCRSVADDALAADQRLIFLAAAAKLADLRDAVGTAADDIAFVPTDVHGHNPARIMALLHSFQTTGDGRRCLGVNESVVGTRTRAALREAQLAESVLNAAGLRSWPMTVLCLYDRSALDESVLTGMRRSHPAIRGEADNAEFEPELADTLFGAELEEPSGPIVTRVVGPDELAEMRTFVRRSATRKGVSAERADDLVLAANEVVSNSLRYAEGDCRVAMWHDGGSMICEVRDRGQILDPLVGRLAPPPTATTGRGLWLANHLCDLVQVRSSQVGTVVRLHVDL
jgi:anti-sigma regulatory factor (Ser/Thr protein kinase)